MVVPKGEIKILSRHQIEKKVTERQTWVYKKYHTKTKGCATLTLPETGSDNGCWGTVSRYWSY